MARAGESRAARVGCVVGRVGALAGVAAALVLAGGCKSRQSAADEPAPSAGLNTLSADGGFGPAGGPAGGAGESPEERLARDAADLQALQEQQRIEQQRQARQRAAQSAAQGGSGGGNAGGATGEGVNTGLNAIGAEVAANATPATTAPATSSSAGSSAGAAATTPSASNSAPEAGAATGATLMPAESPEQRAAREVREAAAALSERTRATPTPATLYFALAGLESVQPGLMPDPAGDGNLLPPERAVIGAVRGMFLSLGADPSRAGDPAVAAAALEGALEQLGAERRVRISKALLATRVLGFGRYEPYESTTFIAGRPVRAILYVEVESFGHRPALGSDPGRRELGALTTQRTSAPGDAAAATDAEVWAVELSQELNLTRDADNLLTWRRPEQSVIEVSRNRRQDFYLIQEIELPGTLSAGSYSLKVTVRDRSRSPQSGRGTLSAGVASGGVAEVIVPIHLVADESAAR